jgi:hypothetical protein
MNRVCETCCCGMRKQETWVVVGTFLGAVQIRNHSTASHSRSGTRRWNLSCGDVAVSDCAMGFCGYNLDAS